METSLYFTSMVVLFSANVSFWYVATVRGVSAAWHTSPNARVMLCQPNVHEVNCIELQDAAWQLDAVALAHMSDASLVNPATTSIHSDSVW
jgi:hypothetical protein